MNAPRAGARAKPFSDSEGNELGQLMLDAYRDTIDCEGETLDDAVGIVQQLTDRKDPLWEQCRSTRLSMRPGDGMRAYRAFRRMGARRAPSETEAPSASPVSTTAKDADRVPRWLGCVAGIDHEVDGAVTESHCLALDDSRTVGNMLGSQSGHEPVPAGVSVRAQVVRRST